MGDIVKSTVILFLICTIVALALAFTNNATKDTIIERARADEDKARSEVFSTADNFEKIEGIDAVIGSNEDYSLVKEAYNAMTKGEKAARVFVVESRGYGGIIKLIVGIEIDGKTTGVEIIDMSETPGLGSKAKDEKFISQFTGLIPKEALNVVKNGKKKDEEINAISGATITSKAVTKGVQAALDVNMLLNERGDL